MSPQISTSTNVWDTIGSTFTLAGDFIAAIWAALWFDYAFFTGQYQIIRWALFVPVSIGLIVSIVMAIRGTSSA